MTFSGFLQLMLIAFKLLNIIDWKWYIVLLPLEMNIILIALLIILGRIISKRERAKENIEKQEKIIELIEHWEGKYRRK